MRAAFFRFSSACRLLRLLLHVSEDQGREVRGSIRPAVDQGAGKTAVREQGLEGLDETALHLVLEIGFYGLASHEAQ